MENIEIKKVTLDDVASLQKIGRQTFAQTFSESNSAEDMEKYLEEEFDINNLLAQVDNTDSRFYFALLDGKVIGYLKLNTGNAQTEAEDNHALEIERIYVLSSYHGKKVGQLLYDKAIQIAREVKSTYVWLGVWEKNPRAIRFYEKNGFVAFDKHIFRLGEDEQTDIMMKKYINSIVDLQPIMENEHIILYPLQEDDFHTLYAVAADQEIWLQHPNRDRWKKEVFLTFFAGAMQSKGAFRVVDKSTGMTIGSTRFYDYNSEESSVFIGYTFFATAYWGKGINHMAKSLMLDHILQSVNSVLFHIGAENIRSQVSITRLGAVKIDEKEVTYFGEAPKLNFVYEISKAAWRSR